MLEKSPPLPALLMAIDAPSNPIGMRMNSAYYLRHEYSNTPEEKETRARIVDALGQGLLNEQHGSLMRHEFAYVLGQLRDDRACSTLEECLQNESDCVMVRHEAAEALGAIGASRSRSVFDQVIEDENTLPELRETCQLALNFMEWRENGGDPTDMPAACACMLSPYSSVDPAPPNPNHVNMSVKEIGAILLNEDAPLFERYRAMFSLRNIGGEEAVLELCRALIEDTSSALFRHEVAYVLGQLQHPSSVEALEESLRRTGEHKMVRHESAEALGAIDGRWGDVKLILEAFAQDEDIVVRESCLVALDAADYWGHSNSDEYDEEDSADQVTNSFAQVKADQKVLVNGHFNVVQ